MNTTETTNPLADYQGFLGCKTRPLTKEESEFFIHMSLASMGGELEKRRDEALVQHKNEIPRGIRIFLSRLQDIELVDLGVILWIGALCKTPGQCVMWAFTITRIMEQNGWRKVTLEDWTNAFPMGLPTDEEEERVWDAQKGYMLSPRLNVDNCLDNPLWWPQVPNKPAIEVTYIP